MKLSRVVPTVGFVAWMLAGCASSRQPPSTSPDGSVPDTLDAALDAAMIDAPPPGMTGEHLRLVTGNLTSGNAQAYEAPGIRILRGLAADVAMLQELNVGTNSAGELRGFVDEAFGATYSFVRGVGQIPNGVVSRYPIIASGEWVDPEVGNRDFVWARIDIPGPVDLFAISVHLLTSSATERDLEASALVRNLSGLPAGAYVVLGGDFNTQVRSEPCVQTLSAVLATVAPYPVDQAGIENTNANRNRPYDWVLVNSALHALETDVVVGRNRFNHGFVADTRVYSPITDLAPAMISDSGVVNMQHMGVVREFLLPGAPAAAVQVIAPNGGETWAAGSSQMVRWTADGVASVMVELTTDDIYWTALAGPIAAAAGQVAVTVPATATSTARVRVSAASGGTPSDESDAFFTISTAPAVGRVYINEVLANEPDADIAAEFVELVNGGTGEVDLSGWTISDATTVRHVFAPGTTLPAGRALVVFGAPTAIPIGLGNAIASSTGALSLANGGDTVTLAAPAGSIDSVVYTSALAGEDGVSMNRNPDGDASAPFALHDTLASSPRSPGTRITGGAF